MKPKPASLLDLRAQVANSYGWRNKADRVITAEERADMTDDQRGEFHWRCDPKALEALVAAERAETRRIHEERAS